jgi:hypothetical protein
MEVSKERKVGCVVPGSKSYVSKRGSIYAPGISAETVGAVELWTGDQLKHTEGGPSWRLSVHPRQGAPCSREPQQDNAGRLCWSAQ